VVSGQGLPFGGAVGGSVWGLSLVACWFLHVR